MLTFGTDPKHDFILMMKRLISTIAVLTYVCLFTVAVIAQSTNKPTAQPKSAPRENTNFRYSKNPPARSSTRPRKSEVAKKDDDYPKATGETASKAKPVPGNSGNSAENKTVTGPRKESGALTTENTLFGGDDSKKPVFESVAQKTREIAKEESVKNLRPTEIYRVGIGDVLFISLQESKSSYYTVLNDGSIDYPLAGGLVSVSGLSVEDIEDMLREKVQLYENPDVSVKVREHASHSVSVLGLVGTAGKQYLQREAIPLYVIRAQALAESTADLVVIKRKDSEELLIRAGTTEFDETLVYPGDVIEFTSSSARGARNGFVYIGGKVNDTGRFGFTSGMTLTQAIMAAGGLKDGKTKKALVRRKDEKGFLRTKSYKLGAIKKGRIVDPELKPGDIIEVGS
jgi:polysaccharide export outer membrane protein